MNKIILTTALVACFSLPAWGHTPICDCYNNGDDTITCEGGFSDGGSAAGIAMSIVDASGKVLIQGKMSEYSDYTFDTPKSNFRVVYQAGDGHVIEIDSRDIEE
ncbi:MAG: hypothetical protein HOM55_07000 [Proteobacteria bacterium]|jgi:hypothetical protein|nr:hypothetical protein [Pseudomonadota bacterium]